MENDELKAPRIPEGWKSATDLKDAGFAGGITPIHRRLKAFWKASIANLVEGGLSEVEAKAIVEKNLVGIKKPNRGPPGLCASPEAIELLADAIGFFNKHEILPTPKNWYTGSQLYREAGYAGGPKIGLKLKALSESLIKDIVAAGIPREEATALVEHNLVGRKINKLGQAAVHASPDAIAMLEREGKIRKKWVERASDSKQQNKETQK